MLMCTTVSTPCAQRSAGHRAIALNETQAAFNRSQITNTIVEGNTFTGVQGSATRLRKSLRLENAKVWSFDLCQELLFPPHLKTPFEDAADLNLAGSSSSSGGGGGNTPSMFAFVGYTIQIEDEAAFVQHKLGPSDGCIARVMTDKPTTATVFIEVDQSKVSLQYTPNAPP